MAIQGLSPEQLYGFQSERNQYGQELGRNKASNLYQQQLGNLQLGRNQRNFNTLWNRRRVDLPTSYLQRGLGKSGIYQGALQNYASDRTNALSDLLLNHQLQQSGMVFNDRGFEDEYANSMSQNYARQLASQSDIAAVLRGVL